MQKYPTGLNTFCYANPQDPAEAVLQRNSPAVGLAVLFPLIFVLIGAGGIYFLWRRQPPETEKPIAAVAVRKSGKGLSKCGPAAIFALLTIVGGVLLYPLGIRPIARTVAAESWAATPRRVLRAEVRSYNSNDGTTYSVYILYQYEFHVQTYRNDRYEFIGGSSSGYQGKAHIVEQYKTASHPICYVNPENPSEAVLKRGFHPKLLLALIPLPFLLVGIGGLLGTMRGNVTVGSRAIGPWRGRRPTRTPHNLSLLRATDSGRAVLTPKFSAKTKLVGVVVIASFWNGIVSIFVISRMNGFRHGDPNWLGLLVLLPFVGVGLGLIGDVVYQLLALFNPRPTLELSSSIVPLGGAAELNWHFAGRTSSS